MRKVYLVTLSIAIMACEKVTPVKKNTVVAQPQAQENAVTTLLPADSLMSDGPFIKRYPAGNIEVMGNFLNGKREGMWAYFYPNGKQWSECYYKEGIKEGPVTTAFENGQKRYEGFYVSGKEQGKWKFWDEKGKLLKEMDFGGKTQN